MKIVKIDLQDGKHIEVIVGNEKDEVELTSLIEWLYGARLSAINIAKMAIESDEAGVKIPANILHAAQEIEVTY